jgi:hypothetical protein
MKRTVLIDPANLCTHCPHEVIRLGSGTLWCPCEDCHPGGLIQGREPKLKGVAASLAPSIEVDDLTTDDLTSDEVWIDPVHRVG